jgi:Rne/Rng family ribonuclease
MSRQILIDAGLFDTRVAVLDNDRLNHFIYLSRHEGPRTGALYLGRVRAFADGMDAAFVDLGAAGSGLLQSADIPAPRGKSRNAPLREKLTEGEKLIVQIIKEPHRDKAFQLTGFAALEGRGLVLRPGGAGLRFAKSLPDEGEWRRRIRETLEDKAGEDGAGVMVRSQAHDMEPRLLQAEYARHMTNWRSIERKARQLDKPGPLWSGDDPALTACRQFCARDGHVLVNDTALYRHLTASLAPDTDIRLWQGTDLLFDHFGIEEEIADLRSVRLPLPSGGNITIEPTEALVAIDVNSGSAVRPKGADSMAYEVNCDAARLVMRHLRLRNLSGMILVDFIQMPDKGAVRKLGRLLDDQAAEDPARIRIIGMTELGLMQITRQRQGPPVAAAMRRPAGTATSGISTDQAAGLVRDLLRFHRNHKTVRLMLKVAAPWDPFLAEWASAIENRLGFPLSWVIASGMPATGYEIVDT